MGSGLCQPCSKTHVGLPSFGILPVTRAEGTWKTMSWLLKLPSENDTYPFHSHFIGQTMSHERMNHRESEEVPPHHMPRRRSAGERLVTSTDHYPKFSQLTCRADGHTSSGLSNLFKIRSSAPPPHFPRCLSLHPVHSQHSFAILFCVSAFPTLPTCRNNLPSKVSARNVSWKHTLHNIHRQHLLKSKRILSPRFPYPTS